MSGLKNYKRVETMYDGKQSWKLIGQDGPVIAYQSFSEELADEDSPFATRKTYMIAISQFLDYAFEAGVFETTTTKQLLNKAIGNYRKFLSQAGLSKNRDIRNIANKLGRITPLSSRSVGVHLSAVDRFLEHSERVAEERMQLLNSKNGSKHQYDEYSSVVDAVNSYKNVTDSERRKLKETVIGGVIRGAAKKWTQKSKSLSVNINKATTTLDENWEFPLGKIADLLKNTKSKRDKAVYCLRAGGGLRGSEAAALRWENINFDNRKIYIKDPRREKRVLLDEDDKIRFKGRNVSRVFLYYPFDDLFFKYLEEYVNSSEYLATENHGYVFQISKGKNQGKPYKNTDDSTMFRNFQNVLSRFDVGLRPDGKKWHPHSLRDSYGVYLKNYFPNADGSEGLPLSIVQLCMGHADIKSTAVYARDKIDKIDELLVKYEMLMSGDSLKVKKLKEIEIEKQAKKLASLIDNKELKQQLLEMKYD